MVTTPPVPLRRSDRLTEGCRPPGPTPGVAIFANNARYKREAYRGTPFTAKILASEGIEVAMKVRSAFWVPNAQFLLTTVNVPERSPGDEFEVFIV